jgi:asparagine synthase (glutamine-hydrolysing)
MCGLTGFWDFAGRHRADGTSVVAKMADSLTHRGPDDHDTWHDPDSGIAFGHRRLSIIDLSPAGHQPMHSANGRYVLSFNGEIYNHLELRRELDAATAVAWRGRSDTETLLAAIERWGVEQACRKATGMFAFTLWDRETHELHLVRDRLGEKPLYYGWVGDNLLFGSELKAIRAHPDWRGDVNRAALTHFLRFSYVPAPESIYQGIYKVIPGTILTFDRNRAERRSVYWSPVQIAQEGTSHRFAGTERDAIVELERLLTDAVSRQMVADVPLGAFLSGGVDSSTIVSFMQSQSSLRVRTFTVGFKEEAYDEAAHARTVARHIGTEHTEIVVTSEEARALIPRMAEIYDEPFADPSQIPTYFVSRLARNGVTVSLSGDGGDELFGGYSRYFIGRALLRASGVMPPPLRRALAGALGVVPPAIWDRTGDMLRGLLPRRLQYRSLGERIHKISALLTASDLDSAYLSMVSRWSTPESLVLGSADAATVLSETRQAALSDPTEKMMLNDLVSYLPDDILVKLDRAAMRVSLETRLPFLDHRVVEFAWRLPVSMRVRRGSSKPLLRQVLYRRLPGRLFNRPKTGFSVPIGEWLRGPLASWAEDLLAADRIRREGYFDATEVQRIWSEHRSGKRNWQDVLWNLLTFQTWNIAQR